MNGEKVQEEKSSRIYDPEISIVNPRVKPAYSGTTASLASFTISHLIKNGYSTGKSTVTLLV
jgi:hypothetical protein